MAHFIGQVVGNRGAASRTGTKSSGIEATISGWDVGCMVTITNNDGHDVVRVYRTGGSNGRTAPKLVAEYKEDEQ